MAIYPIIPGQKLHGNNVIPPHDPSGKSTAPAKNSPVDAGATGDLIDFGDSDPAPSAAAPGPKRDSQDITGMLQATGKDKTARNDVEPLIDFAGDMKKDLPTTANQSGKTRESTMKRSETESSNDAFFDAHE